MPVFPSAEWCEAAIAVANQDPDVTRAGLGWVGDIVAVALPERPHLAEPFAVYIKPVDGKITGFRLIDDLDEIDEIEPAYVAKAPYSVWKGLLTGTMDPIEALVKRKIALQGDAEQVIERARYKDFAMRVLNRIPTTFVDE
jgi:putative sterol carrier protein